MFFELYFFFMNRYGLLRIEAGMWMAAIAAVLYSMSGDVANVYYMGGWDFNVPIMENMLERYAVDNIYRDSVNNNNVLIVANSDAGLIQNYIKENYDESANLIFIKDIDGAKIWRVRNKEVELNEKTNTDLKEIESEINIEVLDGILSISRYCYEKDSNSFRQYAYMKLEDTASGETAYVELAMSNTEGKEDVWNGKYSSISGSTAIDTDREYSVSVILWADGELYEISLPEQ